MRTEASARMPSISPETVDLLGVPITCFSSYDEAVLHIVERIKAGGRFYCVAVNPLKVSLALKSPSFAQTVREAGVHICDGIGTALAVRLLRGRNLCRITGIQLFFDLMVAAQTKGLGIFLLGASPTSNEAACGNLLAQYPALKIVGRHHGYFDTDDAVVDAINASQADVVFVAMGSPKQEHWIATNRTRIDARFIMGVGGTFDVVSGKARWAPSICRRTGTEFLYRLFTQPSRARNAPNFFRFLTAVLKEYVRGRTNSKRSHVHETP